MAKWVRCFDESQAAVVNIDALAMLDVRFSGGGWTVVGVTPEGLALPLSQVYGSRRSAELHVEQLTGVAL